MASNHPQQQVDLLVLGSGAAGMVAALTAARQGLSVMLVEKQTVLGGTTAFSAGAAWIPGTDLAAKAGVANSLETAERYLDWMGATGDDPGMVRAFLQAGPELERFLREQSHVRLIAPTFSPDYRVGPGSAEAGRVLATAEFDGRRLGSDLALIRPPREGFTVLGDMQLGRLDVEALLAPLSSLTRLRHATRILWRHLLSRLTRGRSTRLTMGNALIGMLLLSLREAGVEIRTGQQARVLLRDDDGRVTGALLQGEAGTDLQIEAHCGVVLATGGFGSSAALRAQLLPAPDAGHSVGAPGLDGDGIALAAGVGGRLESTGHGSGAFWMPSSILRHDGRQVLFPHILLDRAKPGLIAVNAAGERFVNEGDSYHDFCEAQFRQDGPAASAWLIFDRRFLRRYGVGLIHPGSWHLARFRRAGYLKQAPTIAGLAAALNLPTDRLAATIARYNDQAGRGRDDDFGKGSRPLNRQNGDPAHRPDPCLAPIIAAPFGAVAVWPATLATSAGLHCDGHARVLDADGRVVEGLYAAGNDMASVMRGTYPGPGTTIGPAMVFGYLAARHAARSRNTPRP